MSKAKIIIITLTLALLSLGAYAVLRKRPENEPGELGGEEPAPDSSIASPTETANFKLSEFACHDGTPVPAEYYNNVGTLMANLQVLRDAIGLPILINSGYRTPDYNKSVGGVSNSYHLRAMAGDLRVPLGMTPASLKAKIESLIAAGKMHNGGIGLYPSFVHYDVGPSRRWNG